MAAVRAARKGAAKPVVVGTDGSEHAERAVAWAARYAERRRGALHVVCAVPPPIAAGMRRLTRSFLGSLEDAGGQVVGRAAAVAREAAPGVPVSTQVGVGQVGPMLLEFAEDAGTLAVDARGRGGTGTLLGSLSSLVARLAPCPVAVVRPVREGREDVTDGPVVVGVDGSENSMHAVAAAFDEASQRGTRLVAVHSWSDVPLAVYSMGDVRSWFDETTVAQSVLAESLAGYASEYPDVEVQRVVTMDRPVDVLAEWSGTAQMLVLGARGRGGAKGLLLGSTAVKVLRSAACPVLIMR